MILHLNPSGPGLDLMNVTTFVPPVQSDTGNRMDTMEDAAYPQWVVASVALGGRMDVLAVVKSLWQCLRKPMHYCTALGQKWLLKAFQICPFLCWPRLESWGRNHQQECEENPASIGLTDPEDCVVQRGFEVLEVMARGLCPPSLNLSLREGGEGREQTRNPMEGKGEGFYQDPAFQLCTNLTLLSMRRCPAASDSNWSSENEEEHQDLSTEDEVPDSAIGSDGISLESDTSDSESTWSDEEDDDDSWELDNENKSLWDSFWNSKDPYNLLSFSSSIGSQPVTITKAPGEPQEDTRGNDCIVAQFIIPPVPNLEDRELPGTRQQRKSLESSCSLKKVCFSPTVTVHPLRVWSFAHRMARRGPWEEMARDRCHFQKRMAEVEAAISWCLEPGHRKTIQTREKGRHYED